MRRDVIVFVGPTLPVAEARMHLDAIYLPPVSQGDVVRAVLQYAPSALAIIDGEFAQRPAVRHKEILWAMAVGVRVYGASSMGAIRAAELSDRGMVGHGLIFRWYRRTRLADDSDVAVAMAPPELGSFALSDALIDIRLTLRRAERQRIIGRKCRLFLEQGARLLHFTERTYSRVVAGAVSEYKVELHHLNAWIADEQVKQKQADAIELLRLLSSSTLPDQPIPFNRRPFEITEAFLFDLESSGLLEVFASHGSAKS